jgi:hypothetical protein
MASWAF